MDDIRTAGREKLLLSDLHHRIVVNSVLNEERKAEDQTDEVKQEVVSQNIYTSLQRRDVVLIQRLPRPRCRDCLSPDLVVGRLGWITRGVSLEHVEDSLFEGEETLVHGPGESDSCAAALESTEGRGDGESLVRCVQHRHVGRDSSSRKGRSGDPEEEGEGGVKLGQEVDREDRNHSEGPLKREEQQLQGLEDREQHAGIVCHNQQLWLAEEEEEEDPANGDEVQAAEEDGKVDVCQRELLGGGALDVDDLTVHLNMQRLSGEGHRHGEDGDQLLDVRRVPGHRGRQVRGVSSESEEDGGMKLSARGDEDSLGNPHPLLHLLPVPRVTVQVDPVVRPLRQEGRVRLAAPI
mmetsp:Transcript_48531/g.152205  ORF Transcript_48531/g.152205 Transcript_48531/m.152205 type:complete len:350 (+) Transcript_48531:835-1884(+)